MTTVAIVVATVLSYFVGWALKLPLLVPVLNTLASFPFMVAALRRGDVRLAITRMLLWALTLAMCATAFAYLRPWEAGADVCERRPLPRRDVRLDHDRAGC